MPCPIGSIADRYGVDTVVAAMEAVFENEERRMRNHIAELPNREFSAADFLDGDGITDDQIRTAATVTVDGEEIRIDFKGTDDQVNGG